MSSVRCPSCQHEIVLKGAKPGRFHPACPLCHAKFLLIVPGDGEGAAQALPVQRATAAVAAAATAAHADVGNATLPPVSGEYAKSVAASPADTRVPVGLSNE